MITRDFVSAELSVARLVSPLAKGLHQQGLNVFSKLTISEFTHVSHLRLGGPTNFLYFFEPFLVSGMSDFQLEPTSRPIMVAVEAVQR